MDRNKKFIQQLSPKECTRLAHVLRQIRAKDIAELDCKKLKGHKNIVRVRVGRIRVIFKIESQVVELLDIRFRDEGTYRNF